MSGFLVSGSIQVSSVSKSGCAACQGELFPYLLIVLLHARNATSIRAYTKVPILGNFFADLLQGAKHAILQKPRVFCLIHNEMT